jgi:hypothetical protein
MIIANLEYQQEVTIADVDVKGGLIKLVIGPGRFYLETSPLIIPPRTGPLGIINTPSVNIPFPQWTTGWGVPTSGISIDV